jgi:hypothetical protein
MSFAPGRFVDRGIGSGEAAEASGQPIPKKIEVMVSAMIARSARARGAIKDRWFVMPAVPLCPPGMPEQFVSQDFRFGLVASIKNKAIVPVYLISFYAEQLERRTNEPALWIRARG